MTNSRTAASRCMSTPPKCVILLLRRRERAGPHTGALDVPGIFERTVEDVGKPQPRRKELLINDYFVRRDVGRREDAVGWQLVRVIAREVVAVVGPIRDRARHE